MHSDKTVILIVGFALFCGILIGGLIVLYPFLYITNEVSENYRDCVNDWSEKMIDGIKCEKMLGQCILKGSGMYD